MNNPPETKSPARDGVGVTVTECLQQGRIREAYDAAKWAASGNGRHSAGNRDNYNRNSPRVSCLHKVKGKDRDRGLRHLYLEDVVEQIRSHKLADQSAGVRETYATVLAVAQDAGKTDADARKLAKAAIYELKLELPAVTWAGTFTKTVKIPGKQVADFLCIHSGLFCADLDGLDDKLDEVRVELLESPHLVLVFRSPSGDGLKPVFKVPCATAKEHKLCLFPAVKAHVKELTGLEIDDCSDVARLCYLAHDSDVSINYNATELPVELVVPERPKIPRSNSGRVFTKDEVQRMLAVIPKRPAYPKWRNIIWAVGDALDEVDAIELLEEWSPEGEGNYSYENMLSQRRTNGNGLTDVVTAGTLVYIAKQHGYEDVAILIEDENGCCTPPPYEPPPSRAAAPSSDDEDCCPMPNSDYVSPPINLLPDYLQDYIKTAASAVNADVGLILLPMLSSLGAAIGYSRSVMLKKGYCEPPILWTAGVSKSGQGKSPIISAATILQTDWDECRVTKTDAGDMSLAKQTRSMDDTTLEAMAACLNEDPRGVLVVKDELSHWFTSHDKYHNGKGSDVSQWLSLNSGKCIKIHRKVGGNVYVPNPRVCLTGGIQPSALRSALTADYFERGLAARFILAAPIWRLREWTDAEVTDEMREAVLTKLRPLWALEPHSRVRPIALPLSPEGQKAFIAFYNECARQQKDVNDEKIAFLSKLAGQAARMALIAQLARKPDATQVEGSIMEAACDLARWAAKETSRIYDAFAETPEQRDRRELIEFVKRRGEVSVRDVQRGPSTYRCAPREKALRALEALVKQGVLERFEGEAANGKAVTKYRLK